LFWQDYDHRKQPIGSFHLGTGVAVRAAFDLFGQCGVAAAHVRFFISKTRGLHPDARNEGESELCLSAGARVEGPSFLEKIGAGTFGPCRQIESGAIFNAMDRFRGPRENYGGSDA